MIFDPIKKKISTKLLGHVCQLLCFRRLPMKATGVAKNFGAHLLFLNVFSSTFELKCHPGYIVFDICIFTYCNVNFTC